MMRSGQDHDKVRAMSRKGQRKVIMQGKCKVNTRSRQSQGMVKARSRQGKGRVKAISRKGHGNVKTRSR